MSVLVIQDKQVVVVASNDRKQILDAIPMARAARNNLTLVPHSIEATQVLRNLGHAVPSPILYYYRWPGKFKPMAHQRDTAAFLTMHKKCIVLNDMGTGKTQASLWASDYLLETKVISRVLVISPLSTLDSTWGDSIFTSMPHRQYAVLHGTSEKRKRLLHTDTDYCIVNHDGFEIIAKEAHGMFDLIIVDEAAALRNPGTDRYKALRRYMDANPNCRLWLMTGTPTPNEPTDAWALAKLVDSPNLRKSYTGFRDEVMMKLGKWKMVPRPNSPQIVSEVLVPAIRFDLKDCVDLPEVVYQTRKVTLTAEQDKAYKAMRNKLVAEVASGAITAANEAVKTQKLVQIACGVAYDEAGVPIELPCKPRVAELLECLEQVGGKAIVFVPLTGVLDMLKRQLSKFYRVGVVNGGVSLKERSTIFRDFQDSNRVEILLAHPATMAHGLTLTSARAIIWYGPITSNEQYTQANARTERIGKKHTTMVIHIAATDLELRMFKRLESKQKLQGILLDMLGEK